MAKIVLESEGKEKTYLFEEAMRIGRSKDNDIVLNNLSVSRNHARLRSENGRFILVDLKSANGTLVNNRKISKTEITHGDVINIGKQELLFLNEEQEARLDAGKGDLDRTMLAERAPECHLTVKKGKKSDKYKIERIETSIGRGAENAIRLPDLFASKRHALVLRQGRDYYMRDLGSWRGTTLNGKAIKEADGPLQLKNNDEIIIGSCILTFTISGGRQAPVAAPQELQTAPSAGQWVKEESPAVEAANPLAENFCSQALAEAAAEEELATPEQPDDDDGQEVAPEQRQEPCSSADKFIDDFVAGTDNILEQESAIEPERTPVVEITDDLQFATEEFHAPQAPGAERTALADDPESASDDQPAPGAELRIRRSDSLTPVEAFLNNERWAELQEMAVVQQQPTPEEPAEAAELVSETDELPETTEPDSWLKNAENEAESAVQFGDEAREALDLSGDHDEAPAEAAAAADAAALVSAEEPAEAAALADDSALVEVVASLDEAVSLVEEAVEAMDESVPEKQEGAAEVAAQFDEEPAHHEAAAVVEAAAAGEEAAVANDDSAAPPEQNQQAQIAIWEQALNNKSEAIKREARRRLKELTGRYYD